MAYVSTDFIKESLYKANMSALRVWIVLRELGIDGFYRRVLDTERFVLLFRLCENGFNVDYVGYDKSKGKTFEHFLNNYCKTMAGEDYIENLSLNLDVVFTYVEFNNLYNLFLDKDKERFNYADDKLEYEPTLI